MLWVEDVKQGLEYQDRSSLRPFSGALDFSSVNRWATAIVAGFGKYEDVHCKWMKNQLMDLEDVEREDGRVGLGRCYADGTGHFVESPAYLRHLGALDEHNP